MRILLLLVLALVPELSEARWVEVDEVAAATNLERLHYRVNKDGSYTKQAELELEVIKDNARTSLGLRRFNYKTKMGEFRVREAFTLNGKEKFPVRPEHIERKPLASSGDGFDEITQVTIAYPRVEVGSKIYYRLEQEVEVSPVPGLFWMNFPVGFNEYQKHLEIRFDSEVPLYPTLHDPDGAVEVRSFEEKGRYQLELRLKKPLFRQLVQEEDSLMDPRSLVWIAVSSARDWKGFPKATPAKYEATISAPLPEKFRDILQEAKAREFAVDQINAVTSGLQQRMRYVGDWVAVDGGHHPRPLATVAETGFGDCKDFSSATAAMLRQLGFEAHVAWVERGAKSLISPLQAAAPDFNHAIVYARRNDREFWIDPTNTTSFAQAIYLDIADRPALVLTPAEVSLRRTPPMRAEDGATRVSLNLKVGKNLKARGEGLLTLTGRSILHMTGWSLFYSKSQIDYWIMDWIYKTSNLSSWKLPAYDLSSRIVSDFKTPFEFELELVPVPTSAGRGYSIPPNPYLGVFEFRRENREGVLNLGEPKVWSREIRFEGVPVAFQKPLRCSGRSEWADYSFEMRKVPGAVLVADKVTLKKARVTVDEIRSPAFAKLQRELVRCLQPATVVLQ